MSVKATYGISMAAAARRAYDLNLISEGQYVSILKQLSARKWRKNEPVEVAQEKPLLICKTIDVLAGEGSTIQRAERLAMPPFTLRAVEAA
jgi:Zn-dependent peptidase ImmA (M78 family)